VHLKCRRSSGLGFSWWGWLGRLQKLSLLGEMGNPDPFCSPWEGFRWERRRWGLLASVVCGVLMRACVLITC
jgi:hypothetical protein